MQVEVKVVHRGIVWVLLDRMLEKRCTRNMKTNKDDIDCVATGIHVDVFSIFPST